MAAMICRLASRTLLDLLAAHAAGTIEHERDIAFDARCALATGQLGRQPTEQQEIPAAMLGSGYAISDAVTPFRCTKYDSRNAPGWFLGDANGGRPRVSCYRLQAVLGE